MAQSHLNLHSGGHLVTVDELREYKAPPPQGRWWPVSHSRVLETVKSTLGEAGYQIRSEKLAIDKDGARFFGTLDLGTPIASGVSLAVGVRNSTDKSYPLGFCAGSRVFVCSNLAFRAELLVKKRHTLRGESRFVTAIATAVSSLKQFKETESERVKRLLHAQLTDDQADALMLRAYERGVIGARDLPRVIHHWREPEHDDFKPRTCWSLLQAFTGALRDREVSQPQQYALQTMRLNNMLDLKSEGAPTVQVHEGGLPKGLPESA